tara:strand:- start:6209 stop:8446 length:2238 start_codon:yes stop_codon:yes gene_type:complete
MQDRGYARFLRGIETAEASGNQAHTSHGREIIKANMVEMESALAEFIDAQELVRRKAPASLLLKGLNLEAVVYMALKSIVNILGGSTKTTSTAYTIGRSISNAITLELMGEDEDNKGLVKHFDKVAKRTTGNDARKDEAVEDSIVYFVKSQHWSDDQQLKVGATLLQLAIKVGLITEKTVGKAKQSYNTVVPTDKTMEMIDVLNLCPEFGAVYLPMVVEPDDWDEFGNGGYHTLRTPFVKTRFDGHTEALDRADVAKMDTVRQSVSIIQQTSWRVHSGLLEVAQAAFDLGMNIKGLPFDYDDSKAKRMGLRVGSMTALTLAQEFKVYPEIWFPHSLDWRGRVYPMPTGLTPQGTKLSKALLSFADGKPITDEGEQFLAIHIANQFGEDKLPLADRVEWVHDNSDKILEVAAEPFGEHQAWWIGSDNPWGFLRACFEWAGYLEDPEGFLGTMPIAFDGSCSGLQHFSAMFLDEIGGRSVNLLPGLERQDIYQMVTNAVLETLSASDDDIAQQWVGSGLIDRTLMKRPTMTYGYSSEVPGMSNQIREELDHKAKSVFGGDTHSACLQLAKVTFAEIEALVVKAAEAKGWLQDSVKSAEGGVSWNTPDGLPVVQKYMAKKQKRLAITVEGKRLQNRFQVATDKVNPRKMASSISPNVIHSLDATHIRMVAIAAEHEGIHSLAMIHDSFGCHAADAPRFFNLIREEFVVLYSGDVAKELNEDLSGGAVTLPGMGDLDLLGVINTDFSFA